MTRDDFPIPRFARSLAEVGRELEDGRGLVLLRRIPVERYSEDELRIALLGPRAAPRHAALPEPQRRADRRRPRREPAATAPCARRCAGGEVRSSRNKARSAGPLRFHTDRVDVVTLLCVRPAATGGLSKVASAVAVHNAILERRPDLHALLCAAVLPHAAGRGGRRAQVLRDAAVRGARRTVHQPVLAHVRRGRPAHPRGAAHDGGPGRGARPVGRDLRGALLLDGHRGRATSSF